MARFAPVAVLAPLSLVAPEPSTAAAEGESCRVLELDFTPAERTEPPLPSFKTPAQIVAWVEDPAGTYVDTVYITHATGTYGLGNRPGRFDFNSGPLWPYGRRLTVFLVWAHRHGVAFQQLVFQDGFDDNLSHSVQQSSIEPRFCQPLLRNEAMWNTADAGTCATEAYTDKGRFSGAVSHYPPRSDLARMTQDDAAVSSFADLNPFDAVSGATPLPGTAAAVTWSVPPDLPPGDYVLMVEVSKELDHNATYSVNAFPSPPDISFSDWGVAYRGQPSVVYRVPFTLADTATTAGTASYAGYGSPSGQDGTLHAPDATITTDVPGSGAQRLALTPEGYRVRVRARPEPDFVSPAAPGSPSIAAVTSRSATIDFVAPGDDDLVGTVRRYEVRIQAGGEITEANFDTVTPVVTSLIPQPAGAIETFELTNLLFATEYVVAIRAIDDCRNVGPIATVRFTTAERGAGEVDACFIATAAYGSAMAKDVDMLRHFRDMALRKTVLGELAVEAYYTFGPAISGVVGESDLLRETTRGLLGPIVDAVGRFRR